MNERLEESELLIRNRGKAEDDFRKYEKMIAQREMLHRHITFKATVSPLNETGKAFLGNGVSAETVMYYTDKRDEKSFEQQAVEKALRICERNINNFEKVGKASNTLAYDFPYNPYDSSQFKYKDIALKQGVHYVVKVERIEHDVPRNKSFDEIKTL